MVHTNGARVDDGVLRVDRKFHVGMQAYAEKIRAPLTTIHPEAALGEATMDLIEVPVSELNYRIMTVKVDRAQRALAAEIPRIQVEISRGRLVYGGGLGSIKIARSLGVPYILILEYDLQTQITVSTVQVRGVVRSAVRATRCAWHYVAHSVPEMRNAHSLHCNGYPIYDATRRINKNNLLYLDSRMSRDMIISRDELAARLASRSKRPLRLLFSGRYERMKGADDAIRVAVECLRMGLDVEMHCYGQGSLRNQMVAMASQSLHEAKIHIHDAVPYTELVTISRSFDLFVCCHIQSDPSCTYLESFGSGLPIVGYGNRMWRRLQEDSGAGFASTLGRPGLVAEDVRRIISDPQTLELMSEKAVIFAEQHCYEREFAKRIDAVNQALAN